MTSTGCERALNFGLSSHWNIKLNPMDAEVEGSADFFLCFTEAAENNVNPGLRHNSSVVGKEFDKACSGEEKAFPSTTAPKKSGGDGG